MVTLDLSAIQGNILRGYKVRCGVHLFFTLPDAAAGARFLAELLSCVTDAQPWPSCDAPPVRVNVALTYAGVRVLGVSRETRHALPVAFREPHRQRARNTLGDLGQSDPRAWDTPLGRRRSHLLVLVFGSDDASRGKLDEMVSKVRAYAADCELSLLHEQPVETLDSGREHFGYADGFAQPAIEGVPGGRPGGGVPLPDGITWRDMKAGEFVLGYADEDGQTLTGAAAWLLRDGTFMVYRKLRQDVEAFHETLRAMADGYARLHPGLARHPRDLDELMAAKVVGRWPDGTALALRPDGRATPGSHAATAADQPDNDFRYLPYDVDGRVCPVGAHIRRTNPRDASGRMLPFSRRHRIIRRGMPYGQPDDSDRGLIFMCFCADIERQFEVIQAEWCMDGNAFGLGRDQDVLMGNSDGPRRFMVAGERPYLATVARNLVVTRGSEYLLMPGRPALEILAGGGAL